MTAKVTQMSRNMERFFSRRAILDAQRNMLLFSQKCCTGKLDVGDEGNLLMHRF